jgi:hypothetical protein
LRRIAKLPTPPNWDDKLSALAKLGLLIGIGGAIYSWAQAVVALQRGSVLAALTASGLAVFMSAAVLTFAVSWLSSSRLHAATGDRGTTLRIRLLIVWCWVITLVGAAFGSGFYIVFIRSGGAELPFAAPGRGAINQFLMGSLLVLSLIGLAALVRRREPGYLLIGRDGVEIADIFQTRTARWEDIVDITDKADKRNPIAFKLRDDKPIVVPNAAAYAAGSPAMYWMVRHYWKHPENRAELTDGRALERLRAEQFDAE